MNSRDKAIERSGGRCEALIVVAGDSWARCWDRPVEVHHALTKARGGRHLDAIGEDYHLICLCRKHHAGADGGDAYDGGLLIDGYVMSEGDGKVVYYGLDKYLRDKYGEQTEQTDQGSGPTNHDEAGNVAGYPRGGAPMVS